MAGSHLVLQGDHRELGRFRHQPEIFADEVDRDVGLLQAASAPRRPVHWRPAAAAAWGSTVCPSSISSRRNWSRCGSRSEVVAARKMVFGIGGPFFARVRRVAQVFEHLGDIVGDVIYSLVKALDRGVTKGLVEFPQSTRLRIALEELVGNQAGVQRTKFRRQIVGVHRRLDDVQQPGLRSSFFKLHPNSPALFAERFHDPMAAVGTDERRRQNRDHRLGVRHLFQHRGSRCRRNAEAVGLLDDGHLLSGKLCHSHLQVVVELRNPAGPT